MSQDSETTNEKKVRLALKAIQQKKSTISDLAEKYKVSEDEIRSWKKIVLSTFFPARNSLRTDSSRSDNNYKREVFEYFASELKRFNRANIRTFIVQILLAIVTAGAFISTAHYACSTNDLVQMEKKPELIIHFLIESELNLKDDKSEGFCFLRREYLDKISESKEPKFYLSIKNNWDTSIKKKEITLPFWGSVLDKTKSPIRKKEKKIKIKLKLGPKKEYAVPLKVRGIESLLNDLKVGRVDDQAEWIRIMIDEPFIELSNFRYAIFKVRYETYKSFLEKKKAKK